MGSTAVGKTAVAVELASRAGGEVISFDSRQVYRGIEISSNAPSLADTRGVPIHLVGILDPRQELTAAAYVALARTATSQVAAGRLRIFTAGTGMYLKAFLEDLDLGGMGAVAGLRQELEAEAQRDLPGLARRLTALSPELAAQTDLRNPTRVVRRMELLWAAALAGGDEPRPGPSPRRVEALTVGLCVAVAEVDEAIATRIGRMLAQGWREEVTALLALDPPASAQVLKSIGVAEMSAHIRGEISLLELRERVQLRTRQYAKRQRTWFRADPTVRWLEVGNRAASDIVANILEMIDGD